MSRIFIYAKATNDAETSLWLGEYVLRSVMAGAKKLGENCPTIKAVCSFEDAKVRYKCLPSEVDDYLEGICHKVVAHNPLQFSIAPNSLITDLLDEKKVEPFEYQEIGKTEALAQFLNGSSDNKKLTADDILILWGHGSASAALDIQANDFKEIWERGFFEDRIKTLDQEATIYGLDNHLQPNEITKALQDNEHHPGLVVFITCQGGTLEVINALKKNADYLLASPGTIFPWEWDLGSWLEGIYKSGFIGAEKAGRAFVEQSKKLARQTDTFVALYNLSKVDALTNAVNNLAAASEKLDGDGKAALQAALSRCDRFYAANRPVITVDLGILIKEFRLSKILLTECDGLDVALAALVVDRDGSRRPDLGGPSIVITSKGVILNGKGSYLNVPFIFGDGTFPTFINQAGWRRLFDSTFVNNIRLVPN
jgi:hypothetical protein